MKFESKIDLDLELTIVDGSEIEVTGPSLSARQAGVFAQMMNDGAAEFDKLASKKRTPASAASMFAGQLSEIYPDIEPVWWTDNLFIGTIKEIRDYVLTALLGVEKKGSTSGK